MGETIQVRREDTRIKIPALIHLSRLGYSYLIRKETTRNRGTNILTEILKQSVERINGRKLTEEAFKQLISDLREALGADDLGFGFYNVIRNGWNGLKIIDYDTVFYCFFRLFSMIHQLYFSLLRFYQKF